MKLSFIESNFRNDSMVFDPELIETVLSTIVTDGIYMDRTKSIEEIFPDPKDIVFYEVSLSPKKDHTLLLVTSSTFLRRALLLHQPRW